MQAPVVFLCGVNDGIFPQDSSEEGLCSVIRNGAVWLISASFSGREAGFAPERFLFYLAATRARERFVLSYMVADDDGSAVEKSSWIHQLCDKGYV